MARSTSWTTAPRLALPHCLRGFLGSRTEIDPRVAVGATRQSRNGEKEISARCERIQQECRAAQFEVCHQRRRRLRDRCQAVRGSARTIGAEPGKKEERADGQGMFMRACWTRSRKRAALYGQGTAERIVVVGRYHEQRKLRASVGSACLNESQSVEKGAAGQLSLIREHQHAIIGPVYGRSWDRDGR